MTRALLALGLFALGCSGSFETSEQGEDIGGESTGGEEGSSDGGASGGNQALGGELPGGSSSGGESSSGGQETGGSSSGGESSSGGQETGGSSSGGESSSGGQETGGSSSGGESSCECSSGPCCDGCNFRGPEFQCATNREYDNRCSDDDAGWCALSGYDRIWREYENAWCSGSSSECDGVTEHSKTVSAPCGDNQVCRGPEGAAYCEPC